MTMKKKPTTPAEAQDLHNQVATATREKARELRAESAAKTALQQNAKVATQNLDVAAMQLDLTALGTKFQRALGALQGDVQTAADALANIRAAYAAEVAELEGLYGKAAIQMTTEAMLANYDEQKKTLAVEMETTRAKWVEDSKRYYAEQARIEAEDAERRRTEAAKFDYDLALLRKRDADTYADACLKAQRAEELRKADLERNWAEREAALTRSEAELMTLREQVAAIPQRVAEEANAKAHARVEAIARDMKHEAAIAAKTAEANAAILGAQLKMVQEQNAKLIAENTALQNRLAAQDAAVKAIAEKALDSASNTKAMAEASALLKDLSRSDGTSTPRRS